MSNYLDFMTGIFLFDFINIGHIVQSWFHVDIVKNMVYEYFLFKMHTKIMLISFFVAQNT
jgi:hypothetical protein